MDVRLFMYASAFLAASLQFIAAVYVLKQWKKVIPLVIILFTLGFSRMTLGFYGPGMFPFPSGTGFFLFALMCSIGSAIGLGSWFCWYLLFGKAALSKPVQFILCGLVIVLYLIITIYIYRATSWQS